MSESICPICPLGDVCNQASLLNEITDDPEPLKGETIILLEEEIGTLLDNGVCINPKVLHSALKRFQVRFLPKDPCE